MIHKISIRNFKSLRDVLIELERFTVFVGPNASGKSSILQALDLLCGVFHEAHRPPSMGGSGRKWESEILQGRSRSATGPVELASESGGKCYRFRPMSSPRQPSGHTDSGKWSGNGQGVAPTLDSDDWKSWTPKANSSSPLPLSVMLQLETSNLLEPKPDQRAPTVMSPEGRGLHAALASMTLNDPDTLQELQANLQRIIPSIRRFRHTMPTPTQPASLLFDTVGGDSLSAHQVSEGTLLVLGLLAALHAPDRPNLVLLDDLDRGLHPKAQSELILLLRGLLKTNPKLQILATTHSPYMLDCMKPKEVRMTHLNEDGSTVCASLTEHPKFEKWKDEFHSGEMWSMFGENWVIEKGTAAP